MKTILVPVDFSKEADYALDVAIAIARKTGAEIKLEHVIQSAFEEEFTRERRLPEEVKEKLELSVAQVQNKLLKKIQSRQEEQVQINALTKISSVFEDVSHIIANQKVDMVVMGTSGASGWKELIDSSTTARVVRHAKSLVLTVGKKNIDFDIKNLVLAIDFEKVPANFIILLNQLQAVFNFKIHLLYVNTPLHYTTTPTIESLMEKFLTKHPFSNYTSAIFCEYSQPEGIIQYAKKVGADVIAMLTHGRDGISHLLDGSVTEAVVNHSPIPVLTYHL